MKKLYSIIAASAIFMLIPLGSVKKACGDPAHLLGSSNIRLGNDPRNGQFLSALSSMVSFNARLSAFPQDYYYNAGAPTPSAFDTLIKNAYNKGVKVAILFEYYSSWTQYPAAGGAYSQWYSIGQAFATRFAPNSSWWTAQGISNFGVTVYQAINEPDMNTPAINATAYHDALKGLADGIHSVNSALKVIPGGFGSANASSNYTCQGYVTAVQDLLNNGTLDGLDLHTYGSTWAPVIGGQHSAYHDFKAVKSASGITRDINYYSTEFNYSILNAEPSNTQISQDAGAKYFLTQIWDQLGVVGNAGQPVTQFALSYSAAELVSEDANFGLTQQFTPSWVGTPRAITQQLVAQLGSGMSWVSADPTTKGLFIMAGAGTKLWAWQDRTGLTNTPGTSFTVTGIPTTATKLNVYGYNGFRQAITFPTGTTSRTVTGLPGNETYMFWAGN